MNITERINDMIRRVETGECAIKQICLTRDDAKNIPARELLQKNGYTYYHGINVQVVGGTRSYVIVEL